MKRVLLINWDNYPNVASGGVYTWAKSLVENMPNWEYVVFNQLSNPNTNARYARQTNVKQVIEMPIFGTNRYDEYYKDDRSFISKVLDTSESVIEGQFLPAYEGLLENLLADDCDPQTLARSICELHKLLIRYDSKKCFEHHLTWERFISRIQADPLYREMRLREALGNFQALQRSLQVLSIKIPKVDLIHCSLAWLPALVAIPAKLERNTPILVTEHGVAFRELVLYFNAYLYNEPSRIFWTVFSRNVVRTVYAFADKIAPVCHANEDWELSLGVEKSKIRVIYNGIDTKRFRPMEGIREGNSPTVVSVARVSVFKDIVNLIQAIGYARESIADIRCLLYGSSTEPEYSARCVELVQSLKLGANFKFMGATKTPEKAYNLADVVAFSSLTEGFPFGVIEAMACGKAVVATDVGGVREALEGCGLLVRSRNPHDLANGMVTLLRDHGLRRGFEAAALKRTRTEFSLENEIREYSKLYDELTISVVHRDHPGLQRELVVRR